MKRRMMVITMVCLIMVSLWNMVALAEPSANPTEPAVVEIDERKEETPREPSVSKPEAPPTDEEPSEPTAPKNEEPAPEATPSESPSPDETPDQPSTPDPEADNPDDAQDVPPDAPSAEDAQDPTPTPETESTDPDVTPAPEPEVQEQPDTQAFKGSISVALSGSGTLTIGDRVTLVATIKDAAPDMVYSLRWEVDDGNGWQTVPGETERTYTFTLTEQNAEYQWRAVFITEA